MKVLDMAVVIVVMLEALGLALSVRVVKQYQLGVLFRLGRVLGPRRPGLHRIVPLVDALHRVSLRIMTMPIQSPHHHPRQRQHGCVGGGVFPACPRQRSR